MSVVPGMTLNCFGVWLDYRKIFCTLGHWTKIFKRIFLSFNKQYCSLKLNDYVTESIIKKLLKTYFSNK